MNKLELVEHIAKEAELTKVSAAAALEAVLDGIAKTLKKGDEVRLVGFGTFSVRERAAGKGRNPATGKEIKIAASKNARFKAGAALKASLNTRRRPRSNGQPSVSLPSGRRRRRGRDVAISAMAAAARPSALRGLRISPTRRAADGGALACRGCERQWRRICSLACHGRQGG